jgi:hypothetical protein
MHQCTPCLACLSHPPATTPTAAAAKRAADARCCCAMSCAILNLAGAKAGFHNLQFIQTAMLIQKEEQKGGQGVSGRACVRGKFAYVNC